MLVVGMLQLRLWPPSGRASDRRAYRDLARCVFAQWGVPLVNSRLMVIAPEGHLTLEGSGMRFKQALQYAFVSLIEGGAIHVFLKSYCGDVSIPR